jgi:DNA-binding CsgD family transcriptional regulator
VPGEILTPNERDILRALALGLSSQEAADRLGIRADAVRAGLKRAMAKLGARSKLGALVVALRTGLIELPA